MRRPVLSVCLLNAIVPTAVAAPNSPADAVELEAVSVYGIAERADGPVIGYRATRSMSATRTDAALREVPQSITVVPRDVVEDTNATRLREVLDYAGGVGSANNFGGQGLTTVTVRGFTTGEYYRNGFPINRGYPNAPDAYTLERLEVIRGPATTLYGRGDPGGTFNVVTKQPEAQASLSTGLQFDSHGMRRVTIDTTGPVDEQGQFTYRINALAEGGNTFRDNVSTERYAVAPVLTWQPSAATRITLEADLMRNNHPLDRGLTNYPNQSKRASSSVNAWEAGTTNKLHNDNTVVQLRFEHALNDDWKVAGGFQWLDGTLKGNAVEANALQSDGRTLGRNFNYRRLDWTDRDFQLNLTGSFSTGGVRHTLLTGVEVEDYDYQSIIRRSAAGANAYPVDLYDPVLGQPRPPLSRTTTHDKENLKTWAAFVQDQISLTDRFKVVAGVRFEHFEHRYRDRLPGASSWRTRDSAVSPRLGVVYDLTETLSVYANTARAYKPNTGADRQGNGFNPEKGKSIEVGAKWELLNEKLSVDVSAYQIDKQNVLTVDPADITYRVAAGKVRSRGFDVNVAGNLTRQWRVIGGYAFVDAAVTQDNTLPEGTRLANIPRSTLSLLNMYEFHEGPARGLGLGVGVRYVGKRAGQTAANTYRMPAYVAVDVFSFYQINRNLRVNLDVTNLFNRTYDEGSFNSYVYPGAPRTAQLGIRYTY
ncbi:TonB-dependent siderophore receptor [Achromobacter pulmonis]|uniref:TonB-dependent siderophore receptor n=1 Tax=Achromobacter pulmonis TaxID=1389932 RepID=UPI001EEE647F|nr:TonB-dependent siderophore receptor [Achromobacter pulmonis]MCF7769465.1 TonB-dependent siderophore receptor [Achromobacter pulmonis]